MDKEKYGERIENRKKYGERIENRKKYAELNRMWMAHRLEEIEFELELTPEEFAKAAGASAGTLRKWKAGEEMPSFESISELCRNLEIGLGDFYNYRPVKDVYGREKRKESADFLGKVINYPLEIFLSNEK